MAGSFSGGEEEDEACRSQLLGPSFDEEEEGRFAHTAFSGSLFLSWPFARFGAAPAVAASDDEDDEEEEQQTKEDTNFEDDLQRRNIHLAFSSAPLPGCSPSSSSLSNAQPHPSSSSSSPPSSSSRPARRPSGASSSSRPARPSAPGPFASSLNLHRPDSSAVPAPASASASPCTSNLNFNGPASPVSSNLNFDHLDFDFSYASSAPAAARGPRLTSPFWRLAPAALCLFGVLGYCLWAADLGSGPSRDAKSQASGPTYGVDSTAFLSAQDPCWWIVWDNCKEANDAACGCRADHPDGPCTACEADATGSLGSTCQKECCGGEKDGCAGNGLAIPTTTTTRNILPVASDGGDGSEASVEVQTIIGMGLGAGPPKPRAPRAGEGSGSEARTDNAEKSDGGLSLWCFALVQPRGIELDVIRMQFERQIGIFACDGHKVYSNESAVIVGNYTPEVVVDRKHHPISLSCDFGTQWHLALNGDIFAHLWAQIARTKPYHSHDVLVKVDADTVFLPQKLRPIVTSFSKTRAPGEAWFLNNCVAPDQYLHGPLEVLSAGAVELFAGSSGATGDGLSIRKCFDMVHQDPTNREDWFFGKCLELLGADRVDSLANQLVSESNCPPFPNPVSCNIHRVAFHPFKDPASWQSCYAAAIAAGAP